MQVSPTLDEFTELAAQYPVVPVSVRLLADRETAVSAFEKLVGDAPGFLFESVEGGDRWARWSFLGWDPEFTLVSRNGVCAVEGKPIDLAVGEPARSARRPPGSLRNSGPAGSSAPSQRSGRLFGL